MASGFIILKDGRCLARNWRTYNYILNLAIDEMPENELTKWLRNRIPKDVDIYDGFGGFYRNETDEHIEGKLDLRELTMKNQKQFWNAIQIALTKLIKQNNIDNNDSIDLLKELLGMKKQAEIGGSLFKMNDWRNGYSEPKTDIRIGPGWE